MREWVESLVGPDYAVPAMATAAAILALLVLFIILRVIRHYSAGTYVAGGRNRKTRLAVMDATAIDAHRRLVLVRRDDVEHLILIGGGADIVVERDIRLAGQPRRAAPPEPHVEPVIAAPHAEQPHAARPAPPRPQPQQPRPAPVPSLATPVRTPPPAPVMRPAPPLLRQQPAPVSKAPPAPADEDFDDELLRELQVELDSGRSTPAKAPAISLDDEMARLLGELTPPKR